MTGGTYGSVLMTVVGVPTRPPVSKRLRRPLSSGGADHPRAEGAIAIAEVLHVNGVLKSTWATRGTGSDLGCGERAGRGFELRM